MTLTDGFVCAERMPGFDLDSCDRRYASDDANLPPGDGTLWAIARWRTTR